MDLVWLCIPFLEPVAKDGRGWWRKFQLWYFSRRSSIFHGECTPDLYSPCTLYHAYTLLASAHFVEGMLTDEYEEQRSSKHSND